MRNLIIEMMQAFEIKAYYPALITALTIPDMCASLDSDGTTTDKKYMAWFVTYAHKYTGVAGDLAYYLRCSILHQGRMMHPQFKRLWDEIVFTIPGGPAIVHNITMRRSNDTKGVFCLSLKKYCEGTYSAVKDWLDKVEETETYKKNSEKYFKTHPQGMAGYIDGIPIIASIR